MMISAYHAPCWHGRHAIRICRAGLGLPRNRGSSASENLHRIGRLGREHDRLATARRARPSIFSRAAPAGKAKRVRPCAFAPSSMASSDRLARTVRPASRSSRTMARAAPSATAAAIAGSARSASTVWFVNRTSSDFLLCGSDGLGNRGEWKD